MDFELCNEKLNLKIKSPTGKVEEITVNIYDTIEQGKIVYGDISGHPMESIRWGYVENHSMLIILENEYTFAHYNIRNGSLVYFLMQRKGDNNVGYKFK
ncbi:hypothetical protein DLAC_00562 [Tieghemostelium lacteum]|uniref:Ubiquitin-like domain-containing protein n=1 Tax=Tieghemostelium lacteum TaxID=361077 RepID=A0A152AA25_TIELA|nr:hypothetical protein DLAC_00562 [Tieghemostelium lacteum]|eukprot:KYR03070.1 hypothetical protein DLAC_00562 [Tieghemostelium lacteum]